MKNGGTTFLDESQPITDHRSLITSTIAFAVVNDAGHISHVNLTPGEARTAATEGFNAGHGEAAWERVSEKLGLRVVKVRVEVAP